MSILTKLFGKSDTSEDVVDVKCPHTAVAPHWDNADDIGKEALASAFVCDACSDEFTPEQYRELRSTEAARLRDRFASN